MFLVSAGEALGMLAGLCFAYPWALVALRGERRAPLLLALTTVALSLGALTLWLMLLALFDALTLTAAWIGIALAAGAGGVVAWRRGELVLPVLWDSRPLPLALAGGLLLVLVMALLVAFNAIYWPFSDADAVAIYANHSRVIIQSGTLPTGEGLYESYPMLLPLGYVYGYLLAGHINEYLAGVVVAALGAGTFGAAYVLGRTLYDRTVGTIAAVLLALTPSFVRWSWSGYTDVPAAFFVTLALVFAARLLRSGARVDALLMGVLAGLAAWTKNSALPVAGMLLLWALVLLWRRRVTWGALVWAAGGLALTAGPWYLRNLLLWGTLVAPTAWTDQAQHTLANVVPFLTHPEPFFVPGIAFTLGLVWALAALVRGRDADRDAAQLLLAAILPLAAVWWWMASYDTRFLLIVLPGIAVLGARALVWLWDVAAARYPRTLRLDRTRQIALVIVVLLLAGVAARKAVSFKRELLRDPFMDDDRRHALVMGPVVELAAVLDALPAEGRLLTGENFLPFYAAHEGRLEIIVGGLPRRADLARYDYLVLADALPEVVKPDDVTLLATVRGYAVYAVTYEAAGGQ